MIERSYCKHERIETTTHLFLVEEPEFCRSSSDIVSDDTLDKDRLHPVDETQVDGDIGESLGLTTPSSYCVQPGGYVKVWSQLVIMALGMKGELNLCREWGNLSDPGKKEPSEKACFSSPPGH